MELIGFVSLTPRPDNGLRSLGQVSDLPAILARERVQEVIIADPDFPQEQAVELVDQCHQRGVTVNVAPSTMEILINRAEFVPGQTVPLFTLRPPVFEGIDYALKRSFDLVVATIGLVVLSPLLVVIALAVKLSSRGPVIYRSERPGMAGRPFACLKFRTMREHADEIQADLESLNEKSGALFKIRNDPRLTRVGGLLRRFSLDELPQLINVVRGEMSLVGPRPLPMRDFERLEDWHKKRYLVLPGITGLWQVSGRSELDFDDLVRLDFLYLEQWSIFLDLSILLKHDPRRRSAAAARSETLRGQPMPPTDRFVISFAAEPPQEGLPYGRWADTLREHFLAAVPRSTADGRGDRRSPGEIAWFPDRTYAGRTYVPAMARTSEGYELFGYVSFSEADGGPARLRGQRRLHLRARRAEPGLEARPLRRGHRQVAGRGRQAPRT